MAGTIRRWRPRAAAPLLVLALGAALVAPAAAAVRLESGAGLSTNYDFARLVLRDGGWPVSVNNVTVLVQWLRAEEPVTHWWDRDNPLNNGLGSGGGSGLGSYRSVVVAAVDVARNLQQTAYGYPAIVRDLASSAPSIVTARAIWRSSWAAGHYGFGADWGTTPVASIAAPPLAWQSPTACPIRYPAGVVGPCGAGFTAAGATWRTGAPGGLERQELWAFSARGGVGDRARWQAQLAAGSYEVDAFVPAPFADATVAYVVTDATGAHRVVVDQEPYANAWVPLGVFSAGPAGITVSLGNEPAAPGGPTFVAADAMRFVRTTAPTSSVSAADGPSVALAPRVPGPPQDVTAVAGVGRATVSWLAPSKDGGAPVEAYTVTAVPSGRQCRAAAPATGEATCVIGGLVDGTAYQFVVAAQNHLGLGPESIASSPARPQGISVVTLSVPRAPRLGGRVVVRAAVTPASAKGSVLFSLDGRALTSCANARIVRGRAGCALRLTSAGRHVLQATYSGSAAQTGTQHATAVLVPRERTRLLAGVGPSTVTPGGVVVLHAWHLPGLASGLVTFRAGAVVLCAAHATHGAARCTAKVTLGLGLHLVVARYAGSKDYDASIARTTLLVAAPATSAISAGGARGRTPRRR